MSDSLWPHGLQHAMLPCPSTTPGACSNSCPSSQWCHPTILSCRAFLLLPSIFPRIRVFSKHSVLPICWPKFWSFSFSFSISTSSEYSGLISSRMDWFDLLAVQGTLKSFPQHHSSKASILCCFWTMVLGKALESPLDCKEIQPVHPKGNQSWLFIGKTDSGFEIAILWPPDAKNWLIWKDPEAGIDWRWEAKVKTKDEMVGWHHWLSGHEFE